MPERDGYIAGVPCWVDTSQPDPDAAAAFHWSVTFSTDDADALAAKATELGGTVLVPPVDAPYSRLTMLRDPGGATFSATAFVPENKDIGRTAH